MSMRICMLCTLQTDRQISKDLQKKVFGYYGYLYMQKKFQDNDAFFRLLPTVTKVDYCFAANRHVFREVCLLLVLDPGQHSITGRRVF